MVPNVLIDSDRIQLILARHYSQVLCCLLLTETPRSNIFSRSCSFHQKLCQIIGWRIPFSEVLDPPMLMDFVRSQYAIVNYWWISGRVGPNSFDFMHFCMLVPLWRYSRSPHSWRTTTQNIGVKRFLAQSVESSLSHASNQTNCHQLCSVYQTWLARYDPVIMTALSEGNCVRHRENKQ